MSEARVFRAFHFDPKCRHCGKDISNADRSTSLYHEDGDCLPNVPCRYCAIWMKEAEIEKHEKTHETDPDTLKVLQSNKEPHVRRVCEQCGQTAMVQGTLCKDCAEGTE